MVMACVILAAGAGSRFQSAEPNHFGRIKLLAPVAGKSLVVRTLELAASITPNTIFVVLGCESQTIASHLNDSYVSGHIEVCINENWSIGLASSIAFGISQLADDIDAVLILLADQVALSQSDLKSLIEAYGVARRTNSAALVCSAYKNSVGVPAIFSRCYFDELKKLSGDQGAKQILLRHPHHAVDMPTAAIDIDTLEDLEKYLSDKRLLHN